MSHIVVAERGPKGRQIGYAVIHVDTQETVAIFKNRDYSYSWQRAKAAAEETWFNLIR
jgi:hypothetical protein